MSTSSAIDQGMASTSDRIYSDLQTAILHGEYRPNQRLVETELGESLGASRTPVREALLRLAFDGLIVRGRQGFSVREFSFDEVQDIYQVRGALEGLAARLAAQRVGSIDDATLREFQRVTDHQEDVRAHTRSQSTDQLILANDEFHDELIRLSGNRRLVRSAKQNRLFYFNPQVANRYTDAQMVTSLEGHAAIFTAIREGRADDAERLAEEHIDEALAIIKSQYTGR